MRLTVWCAWWRSGVNFMGCCMAEDLYKRLKVKRTATPAEITNAYRLRAKEVHPDRNPGDERAASEFREVYLAWQVLSDDGRRARYDATGEFDEGVIANEWKAAGQVIAGALESVLKQYVQAGIDAKQQDFLGQLKGALRAGREQQKKNKVALELAAVQYRTVIERFKVKDGEPNLVAGSAAQQLAGVENAVRNLVEEMAGVEKALKHLEDCGWEFVRSGFGYSSSAATSPTGGYRMFA